MKTKFLKLHYTLNFGKYKGCVLQDVIEGNYIGDFRGIDYLCWLIDNTDYRLDPEAALFLIEKVGELNGLGFYGDYEFDLLKQK